MIIKRVEADGGTEHEVNVMVMRENMKRVYPVLIAQSGEDYLVYVPDMDIYTEGKSLEDAIEMARDAIGLKGIDFEDDGKALPESSNYAEAIAKAREDTEDFDYTQGIVTMVDVDFSKFESGVQIER